MAKHSYLAVAAALGLTACGSPAMPTGAHDADVPGAHGHNFPLAAFSSFRMNETSPDAVEAALGKPFDVYRVNVNFAADKKFDGRAAVTFSFGYARPGSCSPQKWADFLFINGKLQTYHVFSELDGETKPAPDVQKLATLKPGETNWEAAIKILGVPNYWSTGRGLMKDQQEEMAYYWLSGTKPDLKLKRVLITFDGSGLIKAPPTIDRNLNDTSSGRWLCPFPPPIP